MSSHITQLRLGKLIRRDLGALTVADPHQLQVVLVELVRLVRNQNAQSARTIQAEFVELQDSAVRDWDRGATSTNEAVPSPAITHDGFIQRDASLNTRPRAPRDARPELVMWIWVAPTSSGPQPLAPSQPARYYPRDPHLVLVNKTWIPFVKLVEGYARNGHAYRETFELLQSIIETQIGQILSSIPTSRSSEEVVNEALHDGLRKRVPRIETQLRDTLALLRSADR